MHNLSFLSHFTQRQFTALVILGCVRGHVTSRWGIPPPPPPRHFLREKPWGRAAVFATVSLCFSLTNPNRGWGNGNLRVGNWVRGGAAPSCGWYITMVLLGSVTSHVSWYGIWIAWLEAPVHYLCGTWAYCPYRLVVSHAFFTYSSDDFLARAKVE